jgi:long-chain acyl-CoA synthetase
MAVSTSAAQVGYTSTTMNLGDSLHVQAERNPQKTAFYCGNAEISYERLDDSTTALAPWFLSQGLQPGDRVAVHWANSIEAVQLFYGIFKAGLIAVTVNTRLKAPEIGFILSHSQARMCFSEPALAPLAREAGGDCPIFTSLPALSDGEAGRSKLPPVDPVEPALLIYTSGTTSRPKGVTHTHRSVLALSDLVQEVVSRFGEPGLCVLPIMHAGGFMIVAGTLHYGRSLVVLPKFDPAAVLDAIEQFHCTELALMPALWQLVLAEQERAPRGISSRMHALAGGDAVPVALQHRFQTVFGIPLQEVYGLTESVGVSFNPIEALRSGSIGKPYAGVDLRVVDVGGREVAAGETGELLVRSPATCIGYWNDPAATRAALEDGWLRTGDLVSRDGDGYYWFRGRAKEIIIRAGSNISPQEVEEVLYHHPAVREVGVVGQPDPVYGETVVAFIALREGASAEAEELGEFARKSLADYKTPERFVFLPVLPKGLTGKVHRRALKEMLTATAAGA